MVPGGVIFESCDLSCAQSGSGFAVRRENLDVINGAESLADTTEAGLVGQWLIGVGLAAALAGYAVFCFWTGRALILGRRGTFLWEVYGAAANSAAALYLSIAVFMHLHWFWTASPRFWAYAQLGKLLAAVGMIAGLIALFVALLLQ